MLHARVFISLPSLKSYVSAWASVMLITSSAVPGLKKSKHSGCHFARKLLPPALRGKTE